jgi:Raf kinase inhibitor-like YbhB/YbcL family protein
MLSLIVTSLAFAAGAPIPARFTCKGENVSPPLAWSGAPAGTRSFAVIVDDPDAPGGDWVHWLLFNLPASVSHLDAGMPNNFKLANGAIQGINDFGSAGYGGPCPPPGRAHRYRFHVHALDTELGLKSAARKSDLLRAMDGHVLAQGELMATFQR